MDSYCNSYPVSVVAILAMAAGSAAGIDAKLTVSASRSKSTLHLGSLRVASTEARIANPRAYTFNGSPTVLMTWEEYLGASRQSAFALSLDGGRTVAQVAHNPNLIRLNSGAFDPLLGEPVVSKELSAGPENELYLVQFVATPLEEMRNDVRARGGQVLQFLTENTHIVRMTPEARAAVASLPHVRWVGPLHPAYRVENEVRAAIDSGQPLPPARYSFSVHERGMAQQQTLADFIKGLGGVVENFTPDQFRMEATLTREQLVAVLHRNELDYLDPWGGPVGEDMDLIRQTGGAVPLLSTAGFLGQGVRAEVFDSGFQPGHEQWGHTAIIHSDINSVGNHGTACFGVNFARGLPNASATGLLPQREQGIFFLASRCSQFTSGLPSRLTLNTQAVDPAGIYRSCYQTSSVGSTQITNYSTISQEVDDYLFRVDYLSCQSQSNTSSQRSRPQAWAKNIVSVGGLDLKETIGLTDDIKASGASFGPSSDLRVKPDLAHSYGLMVFTTYSTATNGYGQFNGTSSATPITAGHFGLMHQMWHQGVWNLQSGSPTGGAASVFLSRPKSTTAKALMINGAYRYPINSPIPNNMNRCFVGWGLPYLTDLYNNRAKYRIVDWGDPLVNGQTRTYNVNVDAGQPELRFTMVYPDPKPAGIAGQVRVNDLSLKVTSPGGTVYWGNNGMVATAHTGAGQTAGSHLTSPGGAPNTWDTVENVTVANPAAGAWTVEVVASQVVQDGYLATPGVDAVYSLVMSGVANPPPAACYANCDNSTASPVLNVADFTCFLQKFAQGDPYANCDASTSPPELNVADFTCFLQKFALGCP